MHERIERREHRRHVATESQEPQTVAEPAPRRALPPRRQLRAGAHDDQVSIPLAPPAQVGPGFEERIEGLATITEGADEADERPLVDLSERLARSAPLRRFDTREPVGIAPVIDDTHARVGHPRGRHDITLCAAAVAEDHARLGQRVDFGVHVATVREAGLGP